MHEDGVIVGSEASVLGTRFPVSVEGEPALDDGELVFEPQGLEAAGVPVPDELADQLLAGTYFEYPLDRLPYQTTITSVEAEEGQDHSQRQGAEHPARRLSRRLITPTVVAIVFDGRVPGGGISNDVAVSGGRRTIWRGNDPIQQRHQGLR